MDRKNNYNRLHNLFAVGVYSVVALAAPALAQQTAPSNTNIAGPTASATGNVTNQAVQVLQGPYPTMTYGNGVSCAGPSLSVTPFVMGSTSWNDDPTQFPGYNANTGVSVGFNMPLDGSLTQLCRDRVAVEIARIQALADKDRLDFELVRLLRCSEAMKGGFTFHPNSPYASICADIIPINTYNQIVMGQSETIISESQREDFPAEGEGPFD